MQEQICIAGVDVSKAELVICMDDRMSGIQQVPNEAEAIRRWLQKLPQTSIVAMESSGIYHRLLAQLAHSAGFRVYVLNARDVHMYAKAISARAKTDRLDAHVIVRYVRENMEHLRVWKPGAEVSEHLQQLLDRGDKLTDELVKIRQSLRDVPQLKLQLKQLEGVFKDVKAQIDATNPPLYVASVTYGRMVVFTFESEYSAEELNAALEFAYSGGVDVSGNVSVTYKDIISSSKITAFILGGSGGMAAKTIDSYDALIDFIKAGGDYSKDSPGAPIAYKLSYLKDNSPGRMSFTTDYDVKDCERVSQKIRVTLKSIRGESAGGDSGDDLELFGSIWADGTNRTPLFSRDSDHYVGIHEGTSFPQSGFLGDGVLEVSPQPGGQIILGANLTDYDPISANDNIGNEVVVAPFELGWRRDIDVLLTGDSARVVVTFGLQPI